MRRVARPLTRVARTILPPETSVRVSAGSLVKKVKVPLLPVRSGVPMPASDSASQSAGGKLAGMRMTAAGTPDSARSCQKARPVRMVWMPPPDRGMR